MLAFKTKIMYLSDRFENMLIKTISTSKLKFRDVIEAAELTSDFDKCLQFLNKLVETHKMEAPPKITMKNKVLKTEVDEKHILKMQEITE